MYYGHSCCCCRSRSSLRCLSCADACAAAGVAGACVTHRAPVACCSLLLLLLLLISPSSLRHRVSLAFPFLLLPLLYVSLPSFLFLSLLDSAASAPAPVLCVSLVLRRRRRRRSRRRRRRHRSSGSSSTQQHTVRQTYREQHRNRHRLTYALLSPNVCPQDLLPFPLSLLTCTPTALLLLWPLICSDASADAGVSGDGSGCSRSNGPTSDRPKQELKASKLTSTRTIYPRVPAATVHRLRLLLGDQDGR